MSKRKWNRILFGIWLIVVTIVLAFLAAAGSGCQYNFDIQVRDVTVELSEIHVGSEQEN